MLARMSHAGRMCLAAEVLSRTSHAGRMCLADVLSRISHAGRMCLADDVSHTQKLRNVCFTYARERRGTIRELATDCYDPLRKTSNAI